MLNQQALNFGTVRSCIRDLFEIGLQKKAELGEENVYDFSLGNPSVPSPQQVTDSLIDVAQNVSPILLHGYTSAAGSNECRNAVAADFAKRFGMPVTGANFYMTCGAAAGLASAVKALTVGNCSEVMTVAPFFPEYRCFVEACGAKLVVISPDYENFQIKLDEFEAKINENTRAVILNSPNNPSGAILTEETLTKLAEILTRKSKEYGEPIYIISDEPYRELVYGDKKLPFMPDFYKDTLICYSYSKSLSLPGDRIGYICVPDCVTDSKLVFAAVAGAARSLGYVCAPSTLQAVLARCAEVRPDLKPYEDNRKLLFESLTEMGYDCVYPDGAFYLFVKAPNGDSKALSDLAAAEENLLIVPADDFGCPGYMRLAYCVDNAMIKRSLPHFKSLIERFK